MTILVLILTALVAVATLAFGAHQLVTFVLGDGHRQRTARSAPHSHHDDLFDPWSRAA